MTHQSVIIEMHGVRTSFEEYFNHILRVVDQSRERSESSVQRLHVFKRLSTESVTKTCAVVDLNDFSALVQSETSSANFTQDNIM